MKKLILVLVLFAAFLPRPASALATDELLALVAMPLAVAAVSEVADVPANELIDFVSLLNQANVPPTRFVEVVRYVPVALTVETDQPPFLEFVRTRTQTGVSGETLATIIEDRYHTVYSLPEADFSVHSSQTLFNDGRDFVPPMVRTRVARVAEVKRHPHGGPPGQLKKQLGVQTGAEVVHRDRDRVRIVEVDRGDIVRVEPREIERVERAEKVEKAEKREEHGHGGGNGHGNGKGHEGGGKGKGKGKG
jgi:hypothetical protein